MRNILYLLILVHLSVISRTAKILAVLPVPVLSHRMVFRTLTQELTKRGHEVTVITALPLYAEDQMPVNYTEINIRRKSEDILKHLMTEEIKSSEDLVSQFAKLLLLYRVQKAYNEAEIVDNEIIKKHFGRNTPTIHELKRNIHMLFLNIHPIWDSNRPVPSNVIYLGGLHQKPEQELPKELKSNLDSSSNGIIYVSFGTNVNPAILPPEKLQIFINVFSKLPYDVYWKWNDENLPGLTKNIKVLKWFPQADLLRHPKVKLFITQGGLQSTDEAIAGGVPLIGIPIIWDQWFNVEKYVQLKIGLQLDINSVTETKLRDTIDIVIGDKRYKENIIKLQSVMHDQPQSPLEKAVWWTEYVIRHRGAEHLRAPTANMDWMEYYEIKLILYVTISLMLLLAVLIFIILRTLRLYVRKIKTD
ncbi:UDP-glucosyltransferase 2-like isoform X3 [Maniola hyperantus]|uniref:UDP-glucosyltransferase 2-like isoform X3 n=1 Tax=Aphantopus hyperantus TaxID=2795564 RepID=UPI00374A6F7D